MMPLAARRPIAHQLSRDYDAVAMADGFDAIGYEVREGQPAAYFADEPVFGGGIGFYSTHFMRRTWAPDTYPDCVRRHLGRRVWTTPLEQAVQADVPVFIKPIGTGKAFGGQVFTPGTESALDFMWNLETYGGEHDVWCAEVVTIRNEWRVLCLRGEVVAWSPNPYRCASWQAPDQRVAEAVAADLFAGMPEFPASSFDVGLLDDGRTVLVEVNGALALGRYGLPTEHYARCCAVAWEAAMRRDA